MDGRRETRAEGGRRFQREGAIMDNAFMPHAMHVLDAPALTVVGLLNLCQVRSRWRTGVRRWRRCFVWTFRGSVFDRSSSRRTVKVSSSTGRPLTISSSSSSTMRYNASVSLNCVNRACIFYAFLDFCRVFFVMERANTAYRHLYQVMKNKNYCF